MQLSSFDAAELQEILEDHTRGVLKPYCELRINACRESFLAIK